MASDNIGRLILVTGATGHQGGAVARHLIDQGLAVRAFTRDPGKPAGQALRQLGAEVVQGDLNDPESIKRALEGTDGVFSVQQFWETGLEGEIEQGIRLADLADAAGTRQFVYSSVASANKNTGLPHFESKWKIEEHIRSLNLPYTIVRPVFFMDNWGMYAKDQILSGVLPQPLDPDRPLQQIAVDDIGMVVAAAFAHMDQWLDREVDLAGDELTMPETADVFTSVMGRDVRYTQVPWEQFRQMAGEEMYQMYMWFNEVGYDVNIAGLRREFPHLRTLRDFLREQGWVRGGAAKV